MKGRPGYWLIVSLALVLAASPVFQAAASVMHTATIMHEHCPDCSAGAGDSDGNCGVTKCPNAGKHCGAAGAPLAAGSESRFLDFALAYAQLHGLPPDRLTSRIEFCIYRPPIA